MKGAFFEKIDELRGQATDKARELAVTTSKDRATTALDGLVQTVEDAASEIDEKLGSQYGDYARRAAEHIGGFTDSFRDKDIDALFSDARDLVKKSPAVAIGAAAALGFVVARLARSSVAGKRRQRCAKGVTPPEPRRGARVAARPGRARDRGRDGLFQGGADARQGRDDHHASRKRGLPSVWSSSCSCWARARSWSWPSHLGCCWQNGWVCPADSWSQGC